MNNLNIDTDRLSIRILDMRDKEDFLYYKGMPETQKYQSWSPKSISEIEAFIEKNMTVCPNTDNTWLQLAVCLKEGQLIGDVGIHFLEDEQMEIGYTLSPDYQGRGYAIEAVQAVVEYLFSALKKHRVTASVDPDNGASIKLLEKMGFRREAHFIKSFYMNGQWLDDVVYAMLEEEWGTAK